MSIIVPQADIVSPQQALQTPARVLGMAHLHQHTQYSMLDGAAKLKDLLKWVKEITPEGVTPTCAITDHGNMHGAVHFYNYATELGVKPILGCEFYIVPGDHRVPNPESYHLTLLAQNFEGYRNLCRLNTIAWNEGFYKNPRISHDLLEKYSAGIICLSGCVGAEVPKLIMKGALKEARRTFEWYARIFPGRYFTEIQRHTTLCDANAPDHTEAELGYIQQTVNEVIRAWSDELGIGKVATNDGHYIKRDEAAAHEVLLAINSGKRLDDPTRFKFSCDAFYVKTPEEMQELLPASEWGEELYDNTLRVADMVEEGFLPVGKKRVYQLPEVTSGVVAADGEPATPNETEQLVIDSLRGLAARYPELDPETPAGLQVWLSAAERAWKALSPEELKVVRERKTHPRKPAAAANLWRFLATAVELAVERAKAQGLRLAPHVMVPQEAPEDEPRAQMLLRRVEYELGVISKMGFAGYFLIVAEYIGWARDNGISVGPGRGSGAGSIVAYALEITDLDPIAYTLLFERFLNPDRVSMPDFDVDFDDVRRHEVAQHLIDKYGEDRVALIATFQTLKPRVALKDVARTLDVDFTTMNKITSLIPESQGKVMPLREAIKEIAELRQIIQGDARLTRVFETAVQLEGLTKARSTHAAGVVIGREPLANLVPLMRDKTTGMPVVQYDMKAVEDIGLVKMDLLGLRTLSLISEALRLINLRRAKEGLEPLDARKLPDGYQPAFELIGRGETAGVFQLEGSGITSAARMMRPQGIEDVIALGALYRPGPMENIPTYVRRMHGEEQIDYSAFPSIEAQLRPILDVTYGIPVYQEQLMQMASDVAGYSLGEADLLRRAIGKKIAAEMAQQRQIFLEKCDAKGIPQAESGALFDMIQKFADYGFNRSHAAAYGLLTYHTALLKAMYPTEFMAALLTVEQGKKEKVAEYVSEARQMGLTVLPPDINRSQINFEPTAEGEILFGLSAIDGVSRELTQMIREVRDLGGTRMDGSHRAAGPFVDLQDLISAMPAMGRKSNVLTALAYAGALDPLGERGVIIHNIEPQLAGMRKTTKAGKGVPSLFGFDETKRPLEIPEHTLSRLERLRMEQQALGFFLSGHPLEEARDLMEMRSITLDDVEAYFGRAVPDGRGKVRGVLVGVAGEIKRFVTKAGKPMGKVDLSDERGESSVVIFPETWAREHHKLIKGEPFAICVTLSQQESGGEITVSAENIITAEEARALKVPRRVVLHCDFEPGMPKAQWRKTLLDLEGVISAHPGDLAAELLIDIGDERVLMRIQSLVSEDVIAAAKGEFAWVKGGRVRTDDEWIMKATRVKREFQRA